MYVITCNHMHHIYSTFSIKQNYMHKTTRKYTIIIYYFWLQNYHSKLFSSIHASVFPNIPTVSVSSIPFIYSKLLTFLPLHLK